MGTIATSRDASLFNKRLFLVNWKSIVVDVVERPEGVNSPVALDRHTVDGAVVDVLDGLLAAAPKQADSWHAHIVCPRSNGRSVNRM